MIESRKQLIKKFIESFMEITEDETEKVTMADLKKQVELQSTMQKCFHGISYREVLDYFKEFTTFVPKNVRVGNKIVYMMTSRFEGIHFKTKKTIVDFYRAISIK